MSTGAGKLDQFESMFRSALHEVFRYNPPKISRIVLVTDLDEAAGQALIATLQPPLAHLGGEQGLDWQLLPRSAWGSPPAIPTLLKCIQALQPQLIVAHRHLLGSVRDLPYTLGSVIDTLSQAQPVPLLLLPSSGELAGRLSTDGLERVLAVTSHITGDDLLVSWAVKLTADHGELFLAHIEDDITLERYLDVIDRIPGLDSDDARSKIPQKLLDQPRDYLSTIHQVLTEHEISETIVPIVLLGHALTDHRRLADTHDVGLIVVNGRDDQQRAMHGLAHALAIELRHRPVLVL
ncbi:MAG TPA: hypothetical protein ENK18_13150 [Deltaproteobacteria bacterium]|nr:hypothetical protein [Deltaproteobacteria bacterium]